MTLIFTGADCWLVIFRSPTIQNVSGSTHYLGYSQLRSPIQHACAVSNEAIAAASSFGCSATYIAAAVVDSVATKGTLG